VWDLQLNGAYSQSAKTEKKVHWLFFSLIIFSILFSGLRVPVLLKKSPSECLIGKPKYFPPPTNQPYDAVFFFFEFLHGVIPCSLLSKGGLQNFDLPDLSLYVVSQSFVNI
jgi:hypothetical protein